MAGLAWEIRLRHTGLVTEFCTCGASLPEDARFCHKCGKPQFEQTVAQEEPERELAAVREGPAEGAPASRTQIGFHNVLAVRTGFGAALLASMIMQLPLPVYIGFLWLLTWLLGAGFGAVLLYARRSGEALTLRNGARMGWITGVFCFVIAIVMFTISVLLVSAKGGLANVFRETISARAGSDPGVQQVLDMLQSPGGLAALILMTLIAQFLLFTLLPTLGGLLGAKVMEKD